jgi:cell division transport system ATP-binding protein
VTKKFGEVTALKEITFSVGKGEFVFLTGPSAAGKTTIIKLILAEIAPTEGEVFLAGEKIVGISRGKIPFLRRRLGVIFQDFKLIVDRTVFENVALPLEISGKPKEEIKSRVEKILEKVGLSERAPFFPAQLAGGELQRVSLGRALVLEPPVLLADEPTGNLDAANAWQLVKLLRNINRAGTTVLMATHNLDIVNSLSERAIKLEKGRITNDEV